MSLLLLFIAIEVFIAIAICVAVGIIVWVQNKEKNAIRGAVLCFIEERVWTHGETGDGNSLELVEYNGFRGTGKGYRYKDYKQPAISTFQIAVNNTDSHIVTKDTIKLKLTCTPSKALAVELIDSELLRLQQARLLEEAREKEDAVLIRNTIAESDALAELKYIPIMQRLESLSDLVLSLEPEKEIIQARTTNKEEEEYLKNKYGFDKDTGGPVNREHFMLDGESVTLTKDSMYEFDHELMASLYCLREIKKEIDNTEAVERYPLRNKISVINSRVVPMHISDGDTTIVQNALSAIETLMIRAEADDTAFDEIYSDYRGMLSGAKGEDDYRLQTEALLLEHDTWKCLSDVTIPVPDRAENEPKTFENDGIIITDKGIFVIEIKNYKRRRNKNLILNEYWDEVWISVDGNEEVEEASMIKQCEAHVRFLSRYLKNKGLPDVKIYGVCAIANTDLRPENRSGYTVINIDQLSYTINNGEYQTQNIDIDKIYQAIKDGEIESLRFEHPRYAISLTKESRSAVQDLVRPMLYAFLHKEKKENDKDDFSVLVMKKAYDGDEIVWKYIDGYREPTSKNWAKSHFIEG